MTTLAMNNLWTYIDSLGLSMKNRQWLADKLIEPTKSTKESTEKKSSLRTAFSGDWNNDMDSVSYAQILREESVQNNRETASW